MQKGIESLASQLSRPPPHLLLNPDILAAINAFALENLIKQVNLKLAKPFTVLTFF